VTEEPRAWSTWNAEQWNQQLLLFCFVLDADAPPWQGIRASEDDLQALTGDSDTSPAELAHALLHALERQAAQHPEALTPAALMARQVQLYLPTPAKPPPFFAFLWFTCLVAHGFPDPQMEGRFHSRFERLFSARQAHQLGALPDGWEKLIRWLGLDEIFGGAPHRLLQLRPIPGNARRIGHSWTLSFPRLADRRLLLEQLAQDQAQGHPLDPWLPAFISRLQQVPGFSHDFRDELRQHAIDLRADPDLDSWFTGFLLAEIEQLFRSQESPEEPSTCTQFGPLLLKSYGHAIGVLLLADALPSPGTHSLRRVEGRPWGVEHVDLLVPIDPDDPYYAAYDAGSLAIDPHDSPLGSLQPLLNRGLLLFRRDPLLDQLRLVLGAPSGPISHALLRDAHAEAFLEHFGGDSLPCEEEGWQCIRGFSASTDQLRRFPSITCRNRTERPQLIPVGGMRLERSFLATGLGLPAVRIRGPHTPRAVLLLTPDNRSIDYECSTPPPEQNQAAEEPPNRWAPRQRGRRIAAFQTGEARLVAFFDAAPSLECRLALARVEPRPTFLRADPLHCREDWGLPLGATRIDPPVACGDGEAPSEEALSKASFLLNDCGGCHKEFEEQMLEALCATFQRRAQIRRRDFTDIFRQLGSMSDPWDLFLDGVLRAWVEGGWLDEGLSLRRGLWRLQPVDPRLVVLADDRLQLVGLLPAVGLVTLVAHALDLGLTVQAVPPACPHLPRGWRFQGEGSAALAQLARLPLVDRDAWVPCPIPISWQVEQADCDGPAWPSSPQPSMLHATIRGNRNGSHRDPGGNLHYELMAPTTTTIQVEQGSYGRYRWHSEDHSGRFTSCHRNRVALHALNEATEGFWPFGIVSGSHTVLRLYDADAYLPLPIGRFAALVGDVMPGPDLPPSKSKHTYRYRLDPATIVSFRSDRRLPLTSRTS
jgi:hypothetical protein